MIKIHWGRLFAGGLVAAVISFLSDGFLHEKLVKEDWAALYSALGAREPGEHGIALLYFAIFDLGRGFIPMFLYVLMRSHFAPGPKTAVLAAVAGWLAISVTTTAQFIPLGFYSNALWVKVAAYQLATSILATLAGAALYKEPAPPDYQAA
jgi:hypothetical protein